MEQDAATIDNKLFRAVVKLGWVADSRKPADRARRMCEFFGVATLVNVKDAKLSGYAFRIADRDTASGFALSAWLRHAELAAGEVETEPFDPAELKVGRLQHERHVPHNRLNSLRERYEFGP